MRSSFHFISGDIKLAYFSKKIYQISYLLENILNKYSSKIPIEIYEPQFQKDKYVACFGDNSLDMSASRILSLNFILDNGLKIFGPNKTIADLGCGTGRYADFLRNAFGYKRYIGYDIQRHAAWATHSTDLMLFSTIRLGVDKINVSNIDVIFSQSVLEHVKEDKSIFLNFISNVEKNIHHIHLIPATLSHKNYKFHGYRRYGAREIKKLLKISNISNVKIYAFGNNLTRALFADHYGKLGAKNNKFWIQKCPFYQPKKSMFDNLESLKDLIKPRSAREADFFALMFEQKIEKNID